MNYKGPDRRKDNYFFVAQLMEHVNEALDKRSMLLQTSIDKLGKEVGEMRDQFVDLKTEFKVHKASSSGVAIIATIISGAIALVVSGLFWLVRLFTK